MAVRHDYLLAALPVLDEPGMVPPMRTAEFMVRVDAPRARQGVRAVLLGDDLALRDHWMAAPGPLPGCAVLTPAQVAGDAPLPAELAGARTATPALRLPGDGLWEAYFRWTAALAGELESPLLGAWVRTEVALRNGLAAQRTRALGLDGGRWLVAEELGAGAAAEVAPALAAWSGAPDPLAGLRALLRWRWHWVERREPRYSFGSDELIAYAVRLLLVHRWARSHGGGERREVG